MAKRKEQTLNIRIEAGLKRRAKEVAEADGRSLSNWVVRLIRNEVERSGKKRRKA